MCFCDNWFLSDPREIKRRWRFVSIKNKVNRCKLTRPKGGGIL